LGFIVNDHTKIIDDMDGWLKGQPVPSCDQIVKDWGNAFYMYRRRWDDPSSTTQLTINNVRDDAVLFDIRQRCISNFGFAIPCKELLDVLKKYTPIVEIGAGTGYMTALAREYGVDIIGTDACAETSWFDHASYDPMQLKLPGKTAIRRFRDMNVFCSWPSYSRTWFRQALKAMNIGTVLIFINEDCCADDTAKDYLRDCFLPLDYIYIPSWPFIHDHIEIWRKVRQRAK
jgi:hypothetical protein